MTNEISSKCNTLYNKLNTFVTKVINRDVQPQIDDLESDVTSLNNSITNKPINNPLQIIANTDLNNYIDTGFYYCMSNIDASTLSNCPVGYAFSLLVEPSFAYENGVKQTLTTYSTTPVTYFRTFYTTNGTLYNSGWKPLYYDTGWKSITNASGFSTYDSSANPTRYRRIGKIVHIEGIFKNSSELASGSSAVMGTISDASCRPQHPQYALMQGSGKNFFLLQVRANGQIVIERYGTTANAKTGSGGWLHCYITYFVE